MCCTMKHSHFITLLFLVFTCDTIISSWWVCMCVCVCVCVCCFFFCFVLFIYFGFFPLSHFLSSHRTLSFHTIMLLFSISYFGNFFLLSITLLICYIKLKRRKKGSLCLYHFIAQFYFMPHSVLRCNCLYLLLCSLGCCIAFVNLISFCAIC